MNITDLTMAEIEELELLTNESITNLGDESAKKSKLLTALAYLATKRTNPEFTYEQARQLKFSEVSALLNLDPEADPEGE